MKRGFSPLILSIVLVAVMLILTGLILFLPQTQFYEEPQNYMTLEEACSESNLVLGYSVPCDNEITLGFGVTNLGNVDIAKIDFKVKENTGNSFDTSSAGLIPNEAETFFLNVNEIGDVNQIIITPSVEVNDEVENCPSRIFEVASVYSSCEVDNGTGTPVPPGNGGGGSGGGGGGSGGEETSPVLCPSGIDRDLDGYGIGCSLGGDCNDYQYDYDSSCYYVLEPYDDWWAADFALVRDENNLIHNYYIRGALWTTNDTHGVMFGHETSSDLVNWNWEGVALNATGTGTWDDDNVWAPDIEYYNGTYYMFYTGVNRVDEDGLPNHRERNGLATSTDLDNWTRYPVNNCFNTTGDGCLYDCDSDWGGWGTRSGAWAHQCRDPEVYFDEATNNWYMFLTTSIFIDNTTLRSVLDISKSDDLLNWTNIGYLNFTLGPKVESPAIWKENEYYYLFWTSHDSGRLHYSYATSIEGNWSEPKILSESCIPTIHPDCDGNRFMIANEFIVTPDHQLFAYIAGNTRNINFEEFEIVQENNLHDVMFKPITDLPGCVVDLDPFDINPGITDLCEDGIDNDCDGFDLICDATYCESDLDCGAACNIDVALGNGTCNLVTNQCSYDEHNCTINAFSGTFSNHCDISSGDIFIHGEEWVCNAGSCVDTGAVVPITITTNCDDVCLYNGYLDAYIDDELCDNATQVSCPRTIYNLSEGYCDGDDFVFNCTDADSDGYYVGSTQCDGQPGFLGNDDCDDNNNETFFLQDFYLDEDHDIYGTGDVIHTACWGVGGGWDYPLDEMAFNNLDCDDLDDSVWQNLTLYSDSDGDGFGWVNHTTGLNFCLGDELLTNWALTNDDCRDVEADCDDVFGMPYLYCIGNLNLINPGMSENCTNGIDDDCDGEIDGCTCGNGICDPGETCADCIIDCEGYQAADCNSMQICMEWDYDGGSNVPTCLTGCGNDNLTGGCFADRIDDCGFLGYLFSDPSEEGAWGGCEQGSEICCGVYTVPQLSPDGEVVAFSAKEAITFLLPTPIKLIFNFIFPISILI
jgi:hypothetical protein